MRPCLWSRLLDQLDFMSSREQHAYLEHLSRADCNGDNACPVRQIVRCLAQRIADICCSSMPFSNTDKLFRLDPSYRHMSDRMVAVYREHVDLVVKVFDRILLEDVIAP